MSIENPLYYDGDPDAELKGEQALARHLESSDLVEQARQEDHGDLDSLRLWMSELNRFRQELADQHRPDELIWLGTLIDLLTQEQALLRDKVAMIRYHVTNDPYDGDLVQRLPVPGTEARYQQVSQELDTLLRRKLQHWADLEDRYPDLSYELADLQQSFEEGSDQPSPN